MKKFICPHCHSENIQKCSVVYQSGTSNQHYVTTVNGDVESRTTGGGSTGLAQQVAPPVKKETSWGTVIVCGGGAVLCLFSGILIVAAILGVMAFGAYGSSSEADKYNKEEYPVLYEIWLNSYICHRCGSIFPLLG